MKLLLLKIYVIKIPSSVFIYQKSLEVASFGKGKGADVKIYQNVRKLCADSVYCKREEGNSIFSKNIPRVPVVKSLRRNSDSFAGTTIVEIAHQIRFVFLSRHHVAIKKEVCTIAYFRIHILRPRPLFIFSTRKR